MAGLFEKTVSAICYEVASSQIGGAASFDVPPYNDIVVFVLGAWGRMPRFLAWPVRLATLVFAIRGILLGGLFHQLTPQRRRLQLESWRTSSIPACRDLVRFYRSLTIFALYSRDGSSE